MASIGVADSFLSAALVTRTRHAHQVTVYALFQLMKTVFEQYRLSCEVLGVTALSLDEWKVSMTESSPTFHFWALIMQLEVLLLVFLSSLSRPSQRWCQFSLPWTSRTRPGGCLFTSITWGTSVALILSVRSLGKVTLSFRKLEGHFQGWH